MGSKSSRQILKKPKSLPTFWDYSSIFHQFVTDEIDHVFKNGQKCDLWSPRYEMGMFTNLYEAFKIDLVKIKRKENQALDRRAFQITIVPKNASTIIPQYSMHYYKTLPPFFGTWYVYIDEIASYSPRYSCITLRGSLDISTRLNDLKRHMFIPISLPDIQLRTQAQVQELQSDVVQLISNSSLQSFLHIVAPIIVDYCRPSMDSPMLFVQLDFGCYLHFYTK